MDALRIIISCFVLCLLVPLPLKSEENEVFRGWVSVEPQENDYLVEAFASTLHEGNLEYELRAEKNGPAGHSKSTQSGTSSFLPDEILKLSSLRLNRDPAAEYVITLKLYQNGVKVAEHMLVLKSSQRSDAES